jgi:hypothetical protein
MRIGKLRPARTDICWPDTAGLLVEERCDPIGFSLAYYAEQGVEIVRHVTGDNG